MKTFNDLEFIEHPSTFGGVYTKTMFDNGYGIMVYGGKLGKYEIDILDKDENQTYNTPIANDTIVDADSDKVTEIMLKVQSL